VTTFILMRSAVIQHNYPKQNNQNVTVSNHVNLFTGLGIHNN